MKAGRFTSRMGKSWAAGTAWHPPHLHSRAGPWMHALQPRPRPAGQSEQQRGTRYSLDAVSIIPRLHDGEQVAHRDLSLLAHRHVVNVGHRERACMPTMSQAVGRTRLALAGPRAAAGATARAAIKSGTSWAKWSLAWQAHQCQCQGRLNATLTIHVKDDAAVKKGRAGHGGRRRGCWRRRRRRRRHGGGSLSRRLQATGLALGWRLPPLTPRRCPSAGRPARLGSWGRRCRCCPRRLAN